MFDWWKFKNKLFGWWRFKNKYGNNIFDKKTVRLTYKQIKLTEKRDIINSTIKDINDMIDENVRRQLPKKEVNDLTKHVETVEGTGVMHSKMVLVINQYQNNKIDGQCAKQIMDIVYVFGEDYLIKKKER